VQISTCKASGELHTGEAYRPIAIEGENSRFRRPYSHLHCNDTTSPLANPDEYRHKPYIARNHRSASCMHAVAKSVKISYDAKIIMSEYIVCQWFFIDIEYLE